MTDDPNNYVWPDRLLIRDTQIIPDSGGGRIYTTAGFGYVKEPYVREVLVGRKDAEIERLEAEVVELKQRLSRSQEVRTIQRPPLDLSEALKGEGDE